MPRPRILCVDDEPQVLHGLRLTLRPIGDVDTLTDPDQLTAQLRDHGPYHVVCSDMRMPRRDGISVLSEVKATHPETTRILLTGHADIQTAIDAINTGHIYRFLTKPCPKDLLQDAFKSGIHQCELVQGERAIMEQTVRGAVKAMTELMALASPEVFGRAQRVRDIALSLAKLIPTPEQWALEVAALLSYSGAVALNPAMQKRWYTGQPMQGDEIAQVRRIAAIGEELVADIPRLGDVREILRDAQRSLRDFAQANGAYQVEFQRVEARILHVAMAAEQEERLGRNTAQIAAILAARSGEYDPAVIEAIRVVFGSDSTTVKELMLSSLQPGMQLAQDLYTTNKMLMAGRGSVITERFLERIRNSPRGTISEPILVSVQ